MPFLSSCLKTFCPWIKCLHSNVYSCSTWIPAAQSTVFLVHCCKHLSPSLNPPPPSFKSFLSPPPLLYAFLPFPPSPCPFLPISQNHPLLPAAAIRGGGGRGHLPALLFSLQIYEGHLLATPPYILDLNHGNHFVKIHVLGTKPGIFNHFGEIPYPWYQTSLSLLRVCLSWAQNQFKQCAKFLS